MAVPHNLVHLLPNMINLPRSLNASFSGKDQGFLYSMVGGAGSDGTGNTGGIGFDYSITNKSGVKVTYTIDGQEFTVLDGEIKSQGNIPFDRFEITDTTGATAANSVDVILMGLQMSDVISYTKEKPNFAVWA